MKDEVSELDSLIADAQDSATGRIVVRKLNELIAAHNRLEAKYGQLEKRVENLEDELGKHQHGIVADSPVTLPYRIDVKGNT